ncbi:MAG: HAMP domain-containing protein [Treponema sp.]|nr:HAMP domain-containing protein [Treponema sp.]
MSFKQKKRDSDKFIRFSIGAKLVTIITILVLASLGTIIFLVSFLVRQDLRNNAEENNLEINRRTAVETNYTLSNVRGNAQVLIQIIHTAGAQSELAKQAAGFFFEQNKQIAALVFPTPERSDFILVNHSFFNSRGINPSHADVYFETNNSVYKRASRGETVFLNAAPHFLTHLLALFYPMKWGASTNEAVAVLFSPENLNDSFSSILNQSFLINSSGDILLHPDSELVNSGANISNREYVKKIRSESYGSNRQDLFTDEGIQYFIANTKLSAGDGYVLTSVEYKKLFEGIEATTRRNIYLAAAVLFLSILFIWFFSKTISSALKLLSDAARRIESGRFDLNLTPKSRDEIGFLTSSFQKMSMALNVFGRFTNRDIAVKAMRGEIKPGGLPKHGTIFFSDIRGFTEKSEHFTQEYGYGASDKIIFWLNSYFTQMVDCVEKTNGVVDKFIGDAVMAHWGTAYSAGSPAKDAFNGVKAALMMRKALHQLNKNRNPNDLGDPPINIGCGINTGIVTAGQLGSDLRMEYTVIGDPVNLASRIEALNKPLGTDILISENTWNLVRHFFITEEMPSVTVKGKEKPVRIFAVVNHVSVTSGPKTLAEVRKMLGIMPPDLKKVNLDAEEVKYKIADKNNI